MNAGVNVIPVLNLALSFLPVAVVALVMWRWAAGTSTLAWASVRMVVQLVLIGYVLTFVFSAEHPLVVSVVLTVMLGAASWIAMRPLRVRHRRVYRDALLAIAAGGLPTLALVVLAVLRPEPWFEARTLIPIAGMVFSSAMNTVSLAAERFELEIGRDASVLDARRDALNTALIPLINSFLAVGLVALPGMMTGQILAGVAPHVAVRYQIAVMCMTFGAVGIAAIVYLALGGRHHNSQHR